MALFSREVDFSQKHLRQQIDFLLQIALQLDLSVKALLCKGALRESKQQEQHDKLILQH